MTPARLVAAAVAAVGLLLATACDAPSTATNTPARHTDTSSGGPVPSAPLTAGRRLWSRAAGPDTPAGQSFPLNKIETVWLEDDLLIYVGQASDESGERLVVADAATGIPRWSKLGGSSPVSDGRLAYDFSGYDAFSVGTHIIVPYWIGNSGGVAVAGLATRTGKVDWSMPLDEFDHPVAATTTRLLVDSTDNDRSATSSYDLTRRRLLWRHPDSTPIALVGDVAIVDAGHNRLLALDATTGHTRWDLHLTATENVAPSIIGHNDVAAADHGAVALIDTDQNTTLAVDTATGHTLATLPSHCTTDGGTTIACGGAGPLAAATIHRGQLHRSPTRLGIDKAQMAAGIIFAATGHTTTLLDAAGDEYPTKLPSTLIAVNDQYAIAADTRLGDYAADGTVTMSGYPLHVHK